ncbi:MAG: GDSL-type esterase/lipase family protein [Enterobacteriaceae bacterium]|nr:GDSL-type esterase/lipase family protein [Enterobacteriaceae bacterium]
MQISEYKYTLKKVGQVIFIVFLTSLLLIWLNQRSLDNFWQQKYHRNSPWSALKGEPLWDLGNNMQQGAFAASETFMAYAGGHYQEKPQQASGSQIIPPEFQVGLHFLQGYTDPLGIRSLKFPELLQDNIKFRSSALLANQSGENPFVEEIVQKTNVKLGVQDKVLFAGDSMMQGVAPHLKRRLYQEYGIASINLSKQSTGLTYPSFFDWPKTIHDTLDQNPDIKLIIVFLGPNDPWDMPARPGSGYLKFASEGWEECYRERIASILSDTRQRKIDVIWVGPPNMRQKKLSDGMAYLNTLYQAEMAKMGEIYLSANDMFKYQSDNYSDYMGDDSSTNKGSSKSTIKLRSGDGIHFSPSGQKLIADHIFSLIDVIQEPDKENAAL